MSELSGKPRMELLEATDEQIDDAVQYADPMVLYGLLYQLTGDSDLEELDTELAVAGYIKRRVISRQDDIAMLRCKAAAFLKSYRDAGAGSIDIGPRERLPVSLSKMRGIEIPKKFESLYIEELGLSPWNRALEWQAEPDPERLAEFKVIIVGAGMGGLTAALQLKRAGIPFVHLEKNAGVGGTWHENRYPGARLDSLSRSYTNTFGVEFPYPYAFCPWTDLQKYYDWVADHFDLRKHIEFEVEVESLIWDEDEQEWEVRATEKDGTAKVMRANAVLTAVGFLNRPKLPEIKGRETFEGQAWHTSRWPEGADLRDKRVAVIGTGCSGYQMTPELALEVKELTLFQRRPQWMFPTPTYRSPFPPQVNWLDRNLPYYVNFLRLKSGIGGGSDVSHLELTSILPDFEDPFSTSPANKRARDLAVDFLERKLKDPDLVRAMTPPHPVWSARPVAVDPEYSVLDAIQQDHVTLVTEGIECINADGIRTSDGRQIDVDVIVFATGFHATEYLLPMKVQGRDGLTTDALWAEGGARAYMGCMIPGFPNLWTIYGPNTNGGLPPATFHEMIVYFVMRCMERIILDDVDTVEVKPDVYREYNDLIDALNATRVWADPRAKNYYWSRHGRSATQNPMNSGEMWHMLRHPDFEKLIISKARTTVL